MWNFEKQGINFKKAIDPRTPNINSKTEIQQKSKEHRYREKKDTNEPSKQKIQKNVVAAKYSMLNGISEKRLSNSHLVTVRNFPCGTSNTIVEKRDQ